MTDPITAETVGANKKRVIEYTPDGEVLRAFIKDESFIVGAQGPFGSGKSTAAIMKLIRNFQSQKPGPDGWRRKRTAIIRQCFDDETEILTERRGWQLFCKLRADDKVAQLREGRLEFVIPLDRFHYPYVGPMLGFEGQGVDFLVTPEHKLHVSKLRTRQHVWCDYEFATAQSIYGSGSFRVKRNADWAGIDRGVPPAMFEWLGFWFAEGHVGINAAGTRRLCVSQKKPDGIAYVKRLFAETGIPHSVRSRNDITDFHVLQSNAAGRRLYDWLKDCGKQTVRAVPAWMKAAPAEHLRRFIAAFIAGDGNVGASTVAFTSSRRLADDLQEMALKAGLVANIHSRDRRGVAVCINGVQTAATAIEHTVTFVGPAKFHPRLIKQVGRYRGWYTQQYAGHVHCVEVPSHVVYVRRKGVAHWSVNSYPELKSTTLKSWEMWMPLTMGRWREQGPPCHRIVSHATKSDWEILFLALESPEDMKKLLSFELTDAWINEAREMPKAILDALTGRVGRYPPMPADWWEDWRQKGVFSPLNAQIIMDTNPPDTDSWWYVLAEQDVSSERNRQIIASMHEAEQALREKELLGPGQKLLSFYRQPGGRAPNAENLKFLRPGYYELLSAGKTDDWIKVYVDGEYGFIMDGKPVYPMYKESMHCKEFALVKGVGLRLGIDWGTTPACSFSQRLPNGRWLVHREYVSERLGIKTFADEVARILATEFVGYKVTSARGDPSGTSMTPEESSCFKIMNAAGIMATPGPSNNPVRRHEAMEYLLKNLIDGFPAITIHPRCHFLRKGLSGGYHFRRLAIMGSERFREAPEKNQFSHICEALEQDLLSAGEDRNVTMSESMRYENRPKFAESSYDPFDSGGVSM